jgi:hypothetical protein
MDHLDFYDDKKYCAACGTYVRYLVSVDHSYCVQCGGVVQLFSEQDWSRFQESLQARRPKGGRPRKGKGKESA